MERTVSQLVADGDEAPVHHLPRSAGKIYLPTFCKVDTLISPVQQRTPERFKSDQSQPFRHPAIFENPSSLSEKHPPRFDSTQRLDRSFLWFANCGYR